MDIQIGDIVEYWTPYAGSGNIGTVQEIATIQHSHDKDRELKRIYKIKPYRQPELNDYEALEEDINAIYKPVKKSE